MSDELAEKQAEELTKKILLELLANPDPQVSFNLQCLTGTPPREAYEHISQMIFNGLVTGSSNIQSSGWPPPFWSQLVITDKGREFMAGNSPE